MSEDSNSKNFNKSVKGDTILISGKNAISKITQCSDTKDKLQEALSSLSPETLAEITPKDATEKTPEDISNMFMIECLADPRFKSFER